MTRFWLGLRLLGALAAMPGSAFAGTGGYVSETDPRVRFYDYAAEQVYELTAYYGFVTTIYLRADERAEIASSGDPEGWDITTPASRNFIMLKPKMLPAVPTNLEIVTDLRTYSFSLSAEEAPEGVEPDQVTFKVRFEYAEPLILEEVVSEADAAAQDKAMAEEARRAAEEERRAAEARAREEAARIEAETRRRERLKRLGAPSVIFDESVGDKGEPVRRDFSGDRRSDANPDRAFLVAQASAGVDAASATRIAGLDAKVIQGSLISAVLETAIDSQLTGMVRAQVSEPVWSADGRRVLVPAGSRLVGAYQSAVRFGQNRVLIAWNRLVTPEGVSVELGSPGVDALGRAGLGGVADTHFMERFGAAALISMIEGGAAAAVAASSDGAQREAVQGVSDGARENFRSVLAPYMDIPTTISVDQGARVIVFLARDLDFSGVS